MPVAMQAKLLRVLEEGEVERVGGDKPVRVNVRVLVATHRNLEEMIEHLRDLSVDVDNERTKVRVFCE